MLKYFVCAFTCVGSIVFTSFTKPGSSFMETQLRNSRVAVAKNEKDESLKRLSREKGISYPVKHIFIRVFKKDAEMELWASNKDSGAYKLLKTYHICVISGDLGPKR